MKRVLQELASALMFENFCQEECAAGALMALTSSFGGQKNRSRKRSRASLEIGVSVSVYACMHVLIVHASDFLLSRGHVSRSLSPSLFCPLCPLPLPPSFPLS